MTRIYTVHVRAWAASDDRDAVFIREGFSWGAFFFSVIWALVHRMWLAAVVMLAASVALDIATDLLDLDIVTETAFAVALALIFGWEANDWRRRALERRGFVTAGIVAGRNRLEAEQRFFSRTAEVTSGGWTGAMVV
jgi:Protein of unknown function (DUF2628)